MTNGPDRQVNVEQWPIQMVRARPFYVAKLIDSRVFEPWEVDERKQEFFVAEEQPETM